MAIKMHRRDQGRAAQAAALIDLLSEQVTPGHPARATVRELQKLYAPPVVDPRIRDLLERIPGGSLGEKGKRIGIAKGTMWAIWHGKYRPNATVLARIEAAAGETADAD